MYRINSILEGAAGNAVKRAALAEPHGISVVPLSSRSGDANKKPLQGSAGSGGKVRIVRVGGKTRARNTGSVEASK